MFLFFSKWNFLALRLKNFSYFRNKNFLALRLKKIIFQEMELSRLILFLYFRKELSELAKLKELPLKIFFIIQEVKLSSLKLQKLFYFRKEPAKSENQKIIFFSDFLFVEKELLAKKYRTKKFLILYLIKKQNFLN